MANAVFNFQQFTSVDSEGWQCNRSGYLSEEEYVFALAIFIRLKNIDLVIAKGYLKPHLIKLLERSLRQIERDQLMSKLER